LAKIRHALKIEIETTSIKKRFGKVVPHYAACALRISP
jgi:hypothetical protein